MQNWSKARRICPLISISHKFSSQSLFKKSVNLSHSSFVPDSNTGSTNTPILVLHGLLGSKNNWKSLAKVMSIKGNRQVYTLDARNHGDSPHTEDFNYSLMAEDVLKFTEDLKLSNFTLLGHSMGGRTAMMFALMQPKLVEKLIIVDVSPYDMPDASLQIPMYMSTMKEVIKEIPPDCNLTDARNIANKYMANAIPDKNLRFFLLTNLITKAGRFQWKVNLDILIENFSSSIMKFYLVDGTYTGATLFICGGNSEYVRPDEHNAIRRVFPNAEFIYIPGAGHWVHSEKPQEFLTAVHEFL